MANDVPDTSTENTESPFRYVFSEGLPAILDGLVVRGDVTRRAAEGGHANATDLADYLVARGVPFRTAHEQVGRIVRRAIAASATPESLALLMQYDWPGNVRELENALEYAVIVGKGSVILPCTLPANITMNGTLGEADCGSLEPGLRERLNLLEKQIILDVLTRAKGVKKHAAEMLQIDPRNFPYLLRKHDLSGKNEPKST